MADPKRKGDLVKRLNRWVAFTTFEAADILLADICRRGNVFLRQALLATQARKISADHFAHIHAQLMAGLTL